MSEGAIVLSYGDSLLYENDVKSLDPGGWINDKIVGFAFEYFATEQFKAISQDVCLIGPAFSQFLKLCQGTSPEEMCNLLEPLDLENRKYIVAVVNDHTGLDCIGGSHWSTMVYSRSEKKIFYLDSVEGYNSKHAKALQQKIGVCMPAFRDAQWVSVKCPQQSNNDDCGIYAICFAEEICKGVQNKRADFYNVDFSAADVCQARGKLKSLIHELASE